MTKRIFDIIFSAIGLLVLLPFFLVIAILIKLDSKGPVFFRQERIGKDFRPFRIFKFRTMTVDAENQEALITVGGDKRVTRIGRFLRKHKLDELPQLISVLKGDMSLVGPRPEVKKYVELFSPDYKHLLKIRPGITDPASIRYSREEDDLAESENWEDDYVNTILPEKIKLSAPYVGHHSILTDLELILKTIFTTT